MLIKHQKQLKILNNYVLDHKFQKLQEKHFIIKDLISIELYLHLCVKVVILQIIMELEENQFMEEHSQMKILN